jgi:hydrogenase maturation factor
MHDATEGGLTAAVNEIADASTVGFSMEFDRIPIPKEVKILKKHFHLTQTQMLSMSSTGTLIAAVSQNALNQVITTLAKNDIQATNLGIFTDDPHRRLRIKGRVTGFPELANDPYEQIMHTPR